MTAHSRFVAAVALSAATGMTGLVLAQGTGTPPPAQGQQPTAQTPPAAPAGQGQRGAGQAGRQGGGGRRGGFTQFTRDSRRQDVLARGKALYETNCVSCHSADLRGGPKGTNLLRSGTALSDQHGELVGKASPSTIRRSTSSRLIQSRSPSTSTASSRRSAGRVARPGAIRPRRAEHPGRRRQGWRGGLWKVVRHVPFGHRRSQRHRHQVPRPRALQNALGRRVAGRHSPAAGRGGGGAAIP